MLTKKNLFLASSSELKEDRKEFEILICRKNKDWIDKDIFLNLIIWEDFLDAVSKTRLQDEYDHAIRECDIFVMLFFTKVGKYTEEEFETAFGQFKESNNPKIFTYFKNANIKTGNVDEKDLNSLCSFKNKLKDLGHFISEYKNIDDLKYQFNNQLDKLKKNGFIDLKIDNIESSLTTINIDTKANSKQFEIANEDYKLQGKSVNKEDKCIIDDNLFVTQNSNEQENNLIKALSSSNISDLESLYRNSDEKLKEIASKSYLLRRIKNLNREKYVVKTGNEKYALDDRFITNAEYHLFITEMRKSQKPKEVEPDWWQTIDYPREPFKPIRGVRGPGKGDNSDATNFCKWLEEFENNVFNKDTNLKKYSLPTLSQLDSNQTMPKNMPKPIKPIASWLYIDKKKSGLHWIQKGGFDKEYKPKLEKYSEINFHPLNNIYTQDIVTKRLNNNLSDISNLINHFALARGEKFNKNTLLNEHSTWWMLFDGIGKSLLKENSNSYTALKEQFLAKKEDLTNIFTNRLSNKQNDIDTLLKKSLQEALKDVPSEIKDKVQEIFENLNFAVKYTDDFLLYKDKDKDKDKDKYYKARCYWRKFIRDLMLLKIKSYDNQNGNNEERDTLIQTYWWMHILVMREDNGLEAWEGLRIVRYSQ